MQCIRVCRRAVEMHQRCMREVQSSICNASEYAEELWRCIRDALEKCRVQYAGSYSDTTTPIFQLLGTHADLLFLPTWPLHGLCTTLCTLPCTSAHLHAPPPTSAHLHAPFHCRRENGPICELPTETKLMARACLYHRPEICYEFDMQKLRILL